MTSLGYLVLGGVVAAVTVVLHLIVLREPPGEPLPTARFVPPGPAVVRMLARVPSDRWLLALRIVAVLLIGLAFARPRLPRPRVPSVSIVAVDRSAVVGDEREAADSARAALAADAAPSAGGSPAPTPVLIAFDSTPVTVTGGSVAATLRHLRRSTARGSIAAAMLAALRVAAEWRDRADSIQMTVVSPARGDEIDAALAPMRALWPGPIRLVRVAPRLDTASSGASPRIEWPIDGHATHTAPRVPADTVGALVVGDIVVARPFVRRWRSDADSGRAIGRWADGSAAVVEHPTAAGCTREVAAAVDTSEDLLRRPELARLVRALHGACGAPVGSEMRTPSPDLWSSSPGSRRIPARAFGAFSPPPDHAPVLLLALALAALGAETLLRARRRAAPPARIPSSGRQPVAPQPSAAS